MRVVLILWAIPIILFWGWYGLSANDINFGTVIFGRQFHDAVFTVYSNILGVPAEEIPALLAGVFIVDTLIILAIAALRWYKLWLPQTIAWIKEKTGIAGEEREYVSEFYEPGVSNRKSVQGGPAGLVE